MAKKEPNTGADVPAEEPLRLFVTGAGDGVGLAVVREAARRGHQVVGATTLGTEGAQRIRAAGGLPTYPELDRESALYSALMMARADVVINAAPQRLNGLPQVALDYDKEIARLDAETDALVMAAGRADLRRIVHLSAAIVYGETHEAVSEDAAIHADHPLAAAFHDAEQAIIDGGVPGYVLRCGHLYGAQASTLAILEAMRSGQAVARSGHTTSWVFVDDVAMLALAIAEHEGDADEARSTILNVSDDAPMSPDAFIEMLGEEYGTGVPRPVSGFMYQMQVHAAQRALLESGTVINSEAARSAFDWQPEYPTKEAGIDKLLVYMRAQTALPESDSSADDDSKALAIT